MADPCLWVDPPGPALHCYVTVSCDHEMDGRGRSAFPLTKRNCSFLFEKFLPFGQKSYFFAKILAFSFLFDLACFCGTLSLMSDPFQVVITSGRGESTVTTRRCCRNMQTPCITLRQITGPRSQKRGLTGVGMSATSTSCRWGCFSALNLQ